LDTSDVAVFTYAAITLESLLNLRTDNGTASTVSDIASWSPQVVELLLKRIEAGQI
jgi:hypothetical protein